MSQYNRDWLLPTAVIVMMLAHVLLLLGCTGRPASQTFDDFMDTPTFCDVNPEHEICS